MKFRNDDDVRTMFSIFGQYIRKELIELDASLVIFVEEIKKSLIRPKTTKRSELYWRNETKKLV
jgi:hypothetical protein